MGPRYPLEVIVPDDITTTILREIRDQIVGLRADNTQIRDEIVGLRGDHLQLRDEVATLRGEVTTLRGEVTTLRIELKGEISALREELTAMLGDLNDKVEAIGRYAKNMTRRVERAIEELRERVAKLEARRKN